MPALGAAPGRRRVANLVDTTGYSTSSTAGEDYPGLTALTVQATGRPITIEFGAGMVQVSNAAALAELHLYEGASFLGALNNVAPAANAKILLSGGSIDLTPTAGSHTYKLKCKVSAGTANFLAAFSPVYFRAIES